MIIEMAYHPDGLIITPLLAIVAADCDNPLCDESHYRFSAGWLFWTIHIFY
jgi:hypothetical protein